MEQDYEVFKCRICGERVYHKDASEFDISICKNCAEQGVRTLDINKIYCGDCLEVMKEIPDKSIDAIICDLPYGTGHTACSWDSIIPFDKLWEQYRRITKENCPIVLFASQPFTSMLVMSNLKEYCHQWIWNKNNSAGFFNAKRKPIAICEDILVFSKGKVNYYPIMIKGKYRQKGGKAKSNSYNIKSISYYNDEYYPKNLLNFSNANQNDKIHPTQKPLALLEYLIKTYTNEGDLVLDNCSGSGSLAIAAHNTKRNFICIEKNEEYYKKSVERLENSKLQMRLF